MTRLTKEDMLSLADIVTPAGSTNTDLKQFFLRLYQWTESLAEENEKTAKIPEAYGINHLQGIVSPNLRTSKFYQAGLIADVLRHLEKDHGEYEFSVPNIDDTEDAFKEFFGLSPKPRYKPVGDKHYLVEAMSADGGIYDFPSYSTVGQQIAALVDLFNALVDKLNMKHVTADEIGESVSLIAFIRRRCYILYKFLPKGGDIAGYAPFKFTAPKDIME